MSVITLTEQMRQETHPDFQVLLECAGRGELDRKKLHTLNRQVTVDLLDLGGFWMILSLGRLMKPGT